MHAVLKFLHCTGSQHEIAISVVCMCVGIRLRSAECQLVTGF